MRWPIRFQILVPFVGIVVLSITAIAVGAAMFAAARSERQTIDRLRTVVGALDHTNIPFTTAVLQKMRELSGAHFVARAESGRVVASTLPADEAWPGSVDLRAYSGDLNSLAMHSILTLGPTRYFVSTLATPGNPVSSSLVILYPELDWSRERREAAMFPLTVGGATVLLTAIVALWVAHRISARIDILKSQVASIASGNFTEIPVGLRRDEVQDLVVSVNRLCVQLRQMQQAVRESERSKLLAQVAGGLAHQLRNALTGARLSLQIHERRCHRMEDDQTLAVALGQLSLTETHVKGLLSLGRGEQRTLGECQVAPLLHEIAALLDPVCVHGHVSLELLAPDPGIVLHADRESLHSALMNVTLNAIEAAGRGGCVGVAASATDRELCIEISDTGCGPPEALAKTLFDPFVTGKREGVGLGLAIARQVAGDLGGTLTWQRRDQRTYFRFQFPLQSEVSQAEAARQLVGAAKQA